MDQIAGNSEDDSEWVAATGSWPTARCLHDKFVANKWANIGSNKIATCDLWCVFSRPNYPLRFALLLPVQAHTYNSEVLSTAAFLLNCLTKIAIWRVGGSMQISSAAARRKRIQMHRLILCKQRTQRKLLSATHTLWNWSLGSPASQFIWFCHKVKQISRLLCDSIKWFTYNYTAALSLLCCCCRCCCCCCSHCCCCCGTL